MNGERVSSQTQSSTLPGFIRPLDSDDPYLTNSLLKGSPEPACASPSYKAPSPDEWVDYVQAIRHAIIKHKERYIVSPRASINGVRLLDAGVPVSYVKQSVVFKGMPPDMKERIIRDAKIELSAKYPAVLSGPDNAKLEWMVTH